jgi:hypothetical protein
MRFSFGWRVNARVKGSEVKRSEGKRRGREWGRWKSGASLFEWVWVERLGRRGEW